jgi:hypothetical protein
MGTSVVHESEGAPEGLAAINARSKCRTTGAAQKVKNSGLALLLASGLAASVSGETADAGWPSFLPPPAAFPGDIVAAVERLWLAPTLVRTVRERSGHAPFELYAALVDSPEVTAAAARVLGLARYEVEALDDGWYRATDNDGARGVWRLLTREPTRRVILSRGEHSGGILGRINGSALTVLDFEPSAHGVNTTLTARVHIDNRLAAAVARVLIGVFGRLADRKLAEGLIVTSRVAEWAMERPEDFCAWLAREPLPSPTREQVLAALTDCAGSNFEAPAQR